MAQEIVVQAPLQSEQPPWLMSLLAALGNENGKPVLMRGRVVKPEQSRWITARLQQIDKALTSGPDEEPAKAISITKLQAVLGDAGVEGQLDEQLARVRANAYLEAIGDLPAWAIEQAALKWLRGEGLGEDDNPNFVPRPVHLIRIAAAILQPIRAERDQLKLLLQCAPVEQAVTVKTVPAFSRPWWCIFHRFVAEHEKELADLDSAAWQQLRDRVNIALKYSIGWPWPIEKRQQLEEDAIALVQILKVSEQADALSTYYAARNVRFPLPDKAEWIYAPADLLDRLEHKQPETESA